MLKKFINQIFCKHEYEFVRNIYGDEVIFATNWNRSEWKCKKCGKHKLMSELYDKETGKFYSSYELLHSKN